MYLSYLNQDGLIPYWVSRAELENAPCLFFNHGLFVDHHMFNTQRAYFEGRVHMIFMDTPYHGAMPKDVTLSFMQMTHWMECIRKKEDFPKIWPVGMSMGSFPSQLYAHHYPDSTQGLIIIDSMPIDKRYYSPKTMACMRFLGAAMIIAFPMPIISYLWQKRAAHTARTREFLKQSFSHTTKKAMLRQSDAATVSFIKDLDTLSLDCPICLILGTEDYLCGPYFKYINKKWARDLHTTCRMIPNAGHFSNIDNAPFVNKMIEDFLAHCTS